MKPIGGGTSEKPQPEIGRPVEPESKEETAAPATAANAPSHHEEFRPQHHEQQDRVDEQQHGQPPKDHLTTVESQHTQRGSVDDTPIAAATTTEKNETSSSETVDRPRQVIAVSASKGPAAFFNLARKFLITDKECDLSALEGAIVSAVDAAHLLERSKLAKITRVQTSYVTVEPKRKSQETTEVPAAAGGAMRPMEERTQSTRSAAATTGTTSATIPNTDTQISTTAAKSGRKKRGSLRRARIVITVRRTEDYENWLVDNPNTYGGDDEDDEHDLSTPPMKS